MSYYPTQFEHTCDVCGKTALTDSCSHPEGWAFLYQDADQQAPSSKEFCDECKITKRDIYEEYDTLWKRKTLGAAKAK